jgi:hypothetical protein
MSELLKSTSVKLARQKKCFLIQCVQKKHPEV